MERRIAFHGGHNRIVTVFLRNNCGIIFRNMEKNKSLPSADVAILNTLSIMYENI
jgi:hypothetical protein